MNYQKIISVKKIGIPLLFFLVVQANAQVGVNTPLPKSTLEITASNETNPSSTDGLLIPRVATFATTDPGEEQSSMIVFLTKETIYKTKRYLSGYYYWDSTAKNWIRFTDSKISGAGPIEWLVTGNEVSDTDFFGTISNKPINLVRNNIAYGKLSFGTVAIGYEALVNDKGDRSGVAFGYRSLTYNTTGSQNTAVGHGSLFRNTTGDSNTAFGFQALNGGTEISSTGGTMNEMNDNTAIGENALGMFARLKDSQKSGMNTAIGSLSQNLNRVGLYNTSVGMHSLFTILTDRNTALGAGALYYTKIGTDNIGIGRYSIMKNEEGSNNIHIGNSFGGNTNDLVKYSNSIVISNSWIEKENIVENGVYIGGEELKYFITNTQVAVASDKRFKDESTKQVPGLAFINKLRPVTYYWNYDKLAKFKGEKEKSGLPVKLETGFMAQEVEQAAKALKYDFSGVNIPEDINKNTYTLKYAEFVVPLVQAIKELEQKKQNLQLGNKKLRQEIEDLKKLVLQKVN